MEGTTVTVRKTGSAVAAIGFALMMSSLAQAAVTVTTPAVTADPDGYVYCKVVAASRTAIGIVATIRTAESADVTEFGSSWRVSRQASDDGLYHAEETSGSFNDAAQYCQAQITGARRRDVQVTLTVFDANGQPITTVEGQ